jgi:hypothetical protein
MKSGSEQVLANVVFAACGGSGIRKPQQPVAAFFSIYAPGISEKTRPSMANQSDSQVAGNLLAFTGPKRALSPPSCTTQRPQPRQCRVLFALFSVSVAVSVSISTAYIGLQGSASPAESINRLAQPCIEAREKTRVPGLGSTTSWQACSRIPLDLE